MLKTSRRAIQSNEAERRASINALKPENTIGASLALQFWGIFAPSQGTVYSSSSNVNGYSPLSAVSDEENMVINAQQINSLPTPPQLEIPVEKEPPATPTRSNMPVKKELPTTPPRCNPPSMKR